MKKPVCWICLGFATVDLWNWCADLHHHKTEYCDRILIKCQKSIMIWMFLAAYIKSIHIQCEMSIEKWLGVWLRCNFFKSSDSINHQKPFGISYFPKLYVERRGRSGNSIPFIYLAIVKRKGNIRHSWKITCKTLTSFWEIDEHTSETLKSTFT